MRKRKWAESELYLVKIRDHCCGSEEMVIFDVVGYLYKNAKSHIVLTHWKSCDSDWKTHAEFSTIVKSTIISRVNLTEVLNK